MILCGDQPKKLPPDDVLGFSGFAERIAQGICETKSTEGITIGVIGNWGSGKTTMVNLICHYVEKLAPDLVIVPFNPWWFSGHEDLVRKLVQQISKACNADSEGGKKLADLFYEYAEVLEEVPVELKPSLFGLSVDLKKLATVSAKRFRNAKSIPELKSELSELLLYLKIRFLVVVDDVDRLSVQEIQDLFRTIKALGNLPNVTYLLALDKEVVAQSLAKSFPGCGDAYLGKIIQVPLDLPAPSKDGLSKIFTTGLEALLESLKIASLDESRFWTLYRSGIRHLIATPRDAERLLNALKITLPSVAGEVNIADFIAIEVIRLHLPKLYMRIRADSEMFSGHIPEWQRGAAREDLEKFHDELLRSEKWKKEFLSELFPKLHSILDGSSYGSSWLDAWRREKRVCSPEKIDIYFRFSLGNDEASESMVDEVVKSANDGRPSPMLKALVQSEKVTDRNRLWSLIERLEDSADQLSDCGTRVLLSEIITLWSDYRNVDGAKDRSLLGTGNNISLLRLLFIYSKRLNTDVLVELLTSLINELGLTQTLLELLMQIATGFGYFADGPRPDATIISKTSFEKLAVLMTRKILDAADRGHFENTRLWVKAFWFIQKLSPHSLDLLIQRLKSSPWGILVLVSTCATEVLVSTSPKQRYEFALEKISGLVSVEEIAKSLHEDLNTLKDDPKAMERAECFFRDFEKFKNPTEDHDE